MKIVNTKDIPNDIQGIIVSDSGEYVAYRKESGMYLNTIDFNNEKLLKSSMINNEDITDSKAFRPKEIFENKVMYTKIGYEWIEGYGMIDFDGNEIFYTEKMDSYCIKYNDETKDMIYNDAYVPLPIKKYNFDTKVDEVVFDIPDFKNTYNYQVTVSDDLKYILVQKTNTVDDENFGVDLYVYTLCDKNLIATHSLQPVLYGGMCSASFIGDKIVLVDVYGNTMLWNFTKNK